MIRQFIPQEVCLKCLGCCRFSESDSVWLPCLLDEEIQGFLDSKIPPALISIKKQIQPLPDSSGKGFICAFFSAKENRCKVYDSRPFECQLYPVLINLRGKKVLLTVDLNCPYIKEKLNSPELKAYTDYLIGFLNTPPQIKLLKDNPQIIQAYEEVLDLIELNLIDEIKADIR